MTKQQSSTSDIDIDVGVMDQGRLEVKWNIPKIENVEILFESVKKIRSLIYDI